MEKIYSRRRLKIKKLTGIKKIKFAIIFIILGLFLFFIKFLNIVYPIFEEACKSKAESLGANITTSEINKIMSNYDYNDLVYIERTEGRRHINNKSKNSANK